MQWLAVLLALLLSPDSSSGIIGTATNNQPAVSLPENDKRKELVGSYNNYNLHLSRPMGLLPSAPRISAFRASSDDEEDQL